MLKNLTDSSSPLYDNLKFLSLAHTISPSDPFIVLEQGGPFVVLDQREDRGIYRGTTRVGELRMQEIMISTIMILQIRQKDDRNKHDQFIMEKNPSLLLESSLLQSSHFLL